MIMWKNIISIILIRSGDPGLGIGSFVKFKIPDTLTTKTLYSWLSKK